jgi:hypothetical protein
MIEARHGVVFVANGGAALSLGDACHVLVAWCFVLFACLEINCVTAQLMHHDAKLADLLGEGAG